MKKDWSEDLQKEIDDMANIIKVLYIDNQPKMNRCFIWKEIRETGMTGVLALEVMRELGLFKD